MAMLIFQKEEPDYCILETGLGGRLDATNAVENKVLSVITRILSVPTHLPAHTVYKIPN